MKQLSGNNQVLQARVLPKFPAMVTHGIPGLAIGGAIVAGLIINHIIASVWSALPELFSVGITVFGLAWLYSIIRAANYDLLENRDCLGIGVFLGIVTSGVGITAFFVCWSGAHPAPPDPLDTKSCLSPHAGFHDRSSYERNGETYYIVTCNDGYSFTPQL